MKVITTNLLNRFWTNGVKPLKEKIDAMATNFKTANNLTTTASGFALDARQGPVIQQKLDDINSDLGDFIRPADYSAKIYESQCPPGQTVTYTAITNCWVAYNTYGNSSGSNVMINDVQVDAAYTTDNFRANANGLLYLKREDIFSLHSEISSGGYRIYATI